MVSACLGQYYKDARSLFEAPQYNSQQQQQAAPQVEEQYNYKSKKVPPQIISHKQSQNHDGQFKYAFHAENGLAQGEVISPDGTRNGGYTYVDPHGKKILVKYSAGKEGFRILESSDHIPKAIYSGYNGQPVQQPGFAQPQSGGYSQQQSGGYSQPEKHTEGNVFKKKIKIFE